MQPPPQAGDWPNIGDQPDWDEEWAEWLPGKYVLVRITYYDSELETVRSMAQYHGRIVEVKRGEGVTIACEGQWEGMMMSLPPDLGAFTPAEPGAYALETTGEVIDDPDVVTRWKMTAPPRTS